MVGLELLPQRTFEQFHVAVTKLVEWRSALNVGAECVVRPGQRSGGKCGPRFEKRSAGLGHCFHPIFSMGHVRFLGLEGRARAERANSNTDLAAWKRETISGVAVDDLLAAKANVLPSSQPVDERSDARRTEAVVDVDN
jgi:hypothetical protein